ncbi:oxidoreductase [Acetobacter pasteurianus NBRC 3222]|nr:oxidoreductase [Acetobacter pasteurianus NBRC 3222]
MSIRGKIALVTGASSGIGAATARKLATEGVVVGLAARRKDRLDALVTEITGGGGKAVALPSDVTDPASCKAAADALITQFGRIDVLVNNAGLMPLSSVDSLKVDEWKRMVDVNISGVLNRGQESLYRSGRLLRHQGRCHGVFRWAQDGNRAKTQYPRHLHPARCCKVRTVRADYGCHLPQADGWSGGVHDLPGR